MKILGHNKDDGDGGGEAATVAFMDIKSANKAHSVEHKIEDRLLKTDYYDPSSFNVPGSIPGVDTPSYQDFYRAGRDNLYTPFSGPYLSGVLFMSFKLGGAYLLYFSYHGCLP